MKIKFVSPYSKLSVAGPPVTSSHPLTSTDLYGWWVTAVSDQAQGDIHGFELYIFHLNRAAEATLTVFQIELL